MRTPASIARLALAAAAAGAALPALANADLAKKHNCLACHQIAKKSVGPAYKDIAAKYKGDAAASARLVEKIRKGGSGVWGPVPMAPNPNVPAADLETLANWILAGAD